METVIGLDLYKSNQKKDGVLKMHDMDLLDDLFI